MPCTKGGQGEYTAGRNQSRKSAAASECELPPPLWPAHPGTPSHRLKHWPNSDTPSQAQGSGGQCGARVVSRERRRTLLAAHESPQLEHVHRAPASLHATRREGQRTRSTPHELARSARNPRKLQCLQALPPVGGVVFQIDAACRMQKPETTSRDCQ